MPDYKIKTGDVIKLDDKSLYKYGLVKGRYYIAITPEIYNYVWLQDIVSDDSIKPNKYHIPTVYLDKKELIRKNNIKDILE